ncbi:hypothetical protein DUI87_10637 [Hirundo rustica rustica]|uniref:Uncharacterized protein n=1 Tax=Hirundo rustica rustica TaxID=333673 RepID=A0A3M0KJ74_HIRRU|nr:hypothetical protein DUI87_10637 [Hirundo rustica rustica]
MAALRIAFALIHGFLARFSHLNQTVKLNLSFAIFIMSCVIVSSSFQEGHENVLGQVQKRTVRLVMELELMPDKEQLKGV